MMIIIIITIIIIIIIIIITIIIFFPFILMWLTGRSLPFGHGCSQTQVQTINLTMITTAKTKQHQKQQTIQQNNKTKSP